MNINALLRRSKLWLRMLSLILLGVALTALARGEEKKITSINLATIKPLQMILYEISLGVAQSRRLLPDGFSPHDYHLKPKDMVVIEQARLVIWLGGEIEPYLKNIINSSNNSAVKFIDVSRLPGITQLAPRGHHHEGHHHHELDGHLWLDPYNVQIIATAIRDALTGIHGDKKDIIESNFAKFQQRLQSLTFTNVPHPRPFLIYHDAYQYLEKYLNIAATTFVVSDLEQKPGVRRAVEIQSSIEKLAIDCVIVGSTYDSKLLNKLFGDQRYRLKTIDPLASGFDLTAGVYGDFLQDAANKMLSCAGAVE